MLKSLLLVLALYYATKKSRIREERPKPNPITAEVAEMYNGKED